MCSKLFILKLHIYSKKLDALDVAEGPPLPPTSIQQVTLHLEAEGRNAPLLSSLMGSWAKTLHQLTLEMGGMCLAVIGQLFKQCPLLTSLSLILSTMADNPGIGFTATHFDRCSAEYL